MNGESLYLITGLALGWLSLAAGGALLRAARRWRQRQRHGLPMDYGTLLTRCFRRLTTLVDYRELERYLSRELPSELNVERAALLLPDGHQLASAETEGLSLPVHHAAVRWAASAGEAQRSDRGRLRELIREGRTSLAWTAVWVPLMHGSELRGVWLLGARRGGVQYEAEDLRWLTAVAHEAVAVLEAIRHAERERLAAAELRALYRETVRARETERARLSRELHDGALQDLCAVTRDLKALEAGGTGDRATAADLAARSGETVHVLRRICNGLRSPVLQHNLVTALKALVEELDAQTPACVRLDTGAQDGDVDLPEEEALAVFRVAQEALRNAVSHADASEIAVRLAHYPDRLRLTVTDDGKGIPGGADSARFVAQGHFGLAGMRERAAMIGATLDVQTAVDYGTVVVLELPRT